MVVNRMSIVDVLPNRARMALGHKSAFEFIERAVQHLRQVVVVIDFFTFKNVTRIVVFHMFFGPNSK
eukprot:COSAG05_NODE_136_length_16902_cov_21.052312_16_plen_67_part_00